MGQLLQYSAKEQLNVSVVDQLGWMVTREPWFQTIVGLCVDGTLQEEHVDIITQGDEEQKKKIMNEVAKKRKCHKSARSALGKRDREAANLLE